MVIPFRFHDLRHPYVKPKTKNIILKSRKPKLPRFDSLGFPFLYLQLFKEVMDFVNNLNAVVGEYI